MEREPITCRGSSGVEPKRRLVIYQGEQHCRGRLIQWRRRCQALAGAMYCTRPRHRIEQSPKCGLRLGDWIGEAGQIDVVTQARMFRMAKNWTRVAAALDAISARRAA